MSLSYETAPKDLPAPIDDGACEHLPSLALPAIGLTGTDGKLHNLAKLEGTHQVIYCYPMTGVPGQELPPGWDEIPGARGCTPQTCSFRDHQAELAALGYRIYGFSTQESSYQQEMTTRLHLPFVVLSDAVLAVCKALNLPTFTVESVKPQSVLVKRLTLIVIDGIIKHVLYPVFPSSASAEDTIAFLKAHPELQGKQNANVGAPLQSLSQ